MNKLFPCSFKLPEYSQNRIAEVAELIGYSKNQVLCAFAELGWKVIDSAECVELPKAVLLARVLSSPVPEREIANGVSRVEIQARHLVASPEKLPPAIRTKMNRRVLHPSQLRVIHRLMVLEHITRKDYQKMTSSPASTAKRHLAELVKYRILILHKKSRNSWYELAK